MKASSFQNYCWVERNNRNSAAEAKRAWKSAAITESEKKQIELSNSQLQAELLSNVQLFAKELALSRQLLSSSKAALRGSKSEIYNLKRKCLRAAKKQENAVQWAQARVAKDKTTFCLLNKDVYSKEVRNLVCTLTHAGCSHQHIMDIIKAVLETAWITAVALELLAKSYEKGIMLHVYNLDMKWIKLTVRNKYWSAVINADYY